MKWLTGSMVRVSQRQFEKGEPAEGQGIDWKGLQRLRLPRLGLL